MSVIHELCSQILHGSCECEKEDHFLIVVSCLYSSHDDFGLTVSCKVCTLYLATFLNQTLMGIKEQTP